MDLTPGPELYAAAEAAMSDAFRGYTGTNPGQNMWDLNMEKTWRVVAKRVADLAYRAGQEDAAKAGQLPPDRLWRVILEALGEFKPHEYRVHHMHIEEDAVILGDHGVLADAVLAALYEANLARGGHTTERGSE